MELGGGGVHVYIIDMYIYMCMHYAVSASYLPINTNRFHR